MITIPATLGHAMAVLKDLSEQNAAEHEKLGLCQLDVLAWVRKYLKQGESVTVMHKGEPVCVFGILTEEGEPRTWFLANKTYFSLGVAAVLHARRFLKSAVKRHGRIYTGSCSPHPDAERWFEVLGFKKLCEEDGVKWFVYEMTSPDNSASLKPSPSKRYGPEVAAPDPKGRCR